MPLASTRKRPAVYALLLILLGCVGWYAAFALTLDKFAALEDPSASLGCDFSILVQCSANLESWQGSLFGFPNPILGLAAWIAPIVVGAALLAGARVDRWFHLAFNLGVVAALAFVIWLISQSIFVLGTLCPWCMLTWSVTIPLFWLVTLRNLRDGVLPAPAGLRRLATAAYAWIPFLTIACYLVVAVIAQLRLDVLSYVL